MGKFAGFLKRIKNLASNVINKAVKGAKWLKETSRKYYIEPMNSILTTVLPSVKPISDALFAVDDKIIDGMNWIINKTDNKNSKSNSKSNYNKIFPSPINNKINYRPYPKMLPKSNQNQNSNAVNAPTIDRTYLNFNK